MNTHKDSHAHYMHACISCITCMHIMHNMHAYHAYMHAYIMDANMHTHVHHVHKSIYMLRSFYAARAASRAGTEPPTRPPRCCSRAAMRRLLARCRPHSRTRTRACGRSVQTYTACHNRGCLLGHHARTRALVDRSFIHRRYLSVTAVQPCTPTDPCHCALQAANGTGCNRRCCAS